MTPEEACPHANTWVTITREARIVHCDDCGASHETLAAEPLMKEGQCLAWRPADFARTAPFDVDWLAKRRATDAKADEARAFPRRVAAEIERLRAAGDELARMLNEFGPEQKNCIEALNEWRGTTDSIATGGQLGSVAAADNARLHALIKAAEWGDQCGRLGDPSCPWCGVELGGRHEGMGSECPAFAVTGEVR